MSKFNIFSKLFGKSSLNNLSKCTCDDCYHCKGTGIEPNGKIYVVPEKFVIENDVVPIPLRIAQPEATTFSPGVYTQQCISCQGTRKAINSTCPIHGNTSRVLKKTA